MLRSCVGGARLTLTESKRSDQVLFDWYSSLAVGGSRYGQPWEEVLAQARAAFPPKGKADYHLCLSHNTRRRVNKLVQRQRTRGQALRLQGKPPLGQLMWIQAGTRLICAMEQSRAGLHNSQLLVVTSYDATMTHSFVQERTRLGWCFTIASAQGRTLFGSVALHDLRHPRYGRRHLFTSLSRAREAALVSIEDA